MNVKNFIRYAECTLRGNSPDALEGQRLLEGLRNAVETHQAPALIEEIVVHLNLNIQSYLDGQSARMGKKVAFTMLEALPEWENAVQLIAAYSVPPDVKDTLFDTISRGDTYNV